MKRSCAISMGGYEGGLLGISLGEPQISKNLSSRELILPDLTTTDALKDIQTEYAIHNASEASI